MVGGVIIIIITFIDPYVESDDRYGMGLVYLKTGKPAYAEHHFRRAAEINPSNAVLLCCIGMVSPLFAYQSHRNQD